MFKVIGLAALLCSLPTVSSALTVEQLICKIDPKIDGGKLCATQAPEIDPTSALAGVTLLVGGLAVWRGRRARS